MELETRNVNMAESDEAIRSEMPRKKNWKKGRARANKKAQSAVLDRQVLNSNDQGTEEELDGVPVIGADEEEWDMAAVPSETRLDTRSGALSHWPTAAQNSATVVDHSPVDSGVGRVSVSGEAHCLPLAGKHTGGVAEPEKDSQPDGAGQKDDRGMPLAASSSSKPQDLASIWGTSQSNDVEAVAPSETAETRCSEQEAGVGTLVPHAQKASAGNTEDDPITPPLNIKDEPVDEEYDRALLPHRRIKDEPDTSDEFVQQHKSTEELRICSVFSVGGTLGPAAPHSSGSAPTAAHTTRGMQSAPSLPPLNGPPCTVRVCCSGCSKVLQKGQTAFQRKGSSQLFCSTVCLTGYNLPPSTKSAQRKTCHYCLKEIENPKDVIIAPVDTAGAVKDFCSQACLSSFDFRRNTASSTVASECSMCQKTAVITHEVNYQGGVHKLCSDSCFSQFRSSNNLTMNCCENCGGYCYSGNGHCHILQIEGATKKFCSSICVTAYKQKNEKTCTHCHSISGLAEMVEHSSQQGKTEFYCSASCVAASQQRNTLSGASFPCHHCRVMAVPQYHLAMTDGSIRNFCSYTCVVGFQAVFNKSVPQVNGAASALGSATLDVPAPLGQPNPSHTSVAPSRAPGLLPPSAPDHGPAPPSTVARGPASALALPSLSRGPVPAMLPPSSLPHGHSRAHAPPSPVNHGLGSTQASPSQSCRQGSGHTPPSTLSHGHSSAHALPSAVSHGLGSTQGPPIQSCRQGSGHAQPFTVSRGLIRLSCKQCYHLFSTKPELLQFKGQMLVFCRKSCSEEFKKVNSVSARCEYCKIEKVVKDVVKFNHLDRPFCSEGCKLLYKHDLAKRSGSHCRSCAFCTNTAQKMIQNHFGGKLEEFCREECMSLYTVLFYQMAKCDTCRRQGKLSESLKWLGEMKHFCNLLCLLQFCSQHASGDPRVAVTGTSTQVPSLIHPVSAETPQPLPLPPHLAGPSALTPLPNLPSKEATPVIANVVSLASVPTGQPSITANMALQGTVPSAHGQAKIIGDASTQTDAMKAPAAPRRMLKNKALLCKPISQNKGTLCKPQTESTETQTDEPEKMKVLILPVPVPIFVPVPLHMFTQYTPYPMGLPVPVPVPMFLPATADGAERILQTIQEVKDGDPSCIVAEEEEEEKDKMVSHGDQGSTYSGDLESEAVSTPHSWEGDPTPTTQRFGPRAGSSETLSTPTMVDLEADFPVESIELMAVKGQSALPRPRGRRRPRDGFPPRKRGRKRAASVVTAGVARSAMPPIGSTKLHHLYGVNAWSGWVQWRSRQPNLEQPKHGTRPVVLKEDVLQCTSAELSYGLCRFIREVRRPNGEEYTPDSVFYLCLGIQQYLFENGRIENIFTDLFYSKFTLEITRMLKDWKPTIFPTGYLHSRVEEEYLWECKQLGAYSPIVLLNTLLFFSTKLFHLKSLRQHRRLSFAHVTRCTKTSGGTKTTCLRFHHSRRNRPGSDMPALPAKRKAEEDEDVMEMPENTDNPLRCPVRLYEFYLSKCSDSVKQRSDLFYLQPERTCVPSSPLWFSSQPLESAILESMLTRILTVREVHLEGNQPQQSAPSADSETD